MPELTVRAHTLTDPGRRRQVNEDWCGSTAPRTEEERSRNGWLLVVADGVGAYGTGEEASRTAGDTILSTYPASHDGTPGERLRLAIQTANRALWERRRHYVRLGQSRPVMSTLLAAAIVGDRVFLANVGDCRGYLVRDGQVRQVTRDHTWVSEQVARGLLRPDEAATHPRAHVITRSLGQYSSVEVDLFEVPLRPGDRLVLCSDGLTRHVGDAEIVEHVRSQPPDTAARRLLELANARGGEDNITVALAEIVAAAPPRRAAEPQRPRPPATAQPRAPVVPAQPPAPELPDTAEQPAIQATPAVAPPPEPTPPVRQRPPAPAQPAPAPHRQVVGAPLAAPSGYLEALETISARLNASLDFQATLSSVLDTVVEVTGAQRGCVLLRDEAKGELALSAGFNMENGPSGPALSRGIAQSVFESGEAVCIADATADEQFGARDSVVLRNLRSVMCVPLSVRGERLGVVYVEHQFGAGVFDEAELNLLKAVADQAAIALANARLHEDLRRQVAEVSRMRSYQDNVLGSVSSAIISLDESGRVVTFNRMAEELLAVPVAEAAGAPLRSLITPSLHRMITALSGDEGGDEQGFQRVEAEVRLPTRGRATISLRVLPLLDDERQRMGSVVMIDDLTQQKQLTEARQREESEKERIKALFGRYMSPAVVDQLVEDPGSIRLGGTQRVVTVLFADIRGFTALSERHSPEEVVSILNSYLACATEAILENEGTLDKFLGDGVMAFFNAPLEQEDHVMAAVRSAFLMRERLREQFDVRDLRLGFGAGINTGPAIVGNIGTAELMNYTCIGDTVNVAARLQAEARAGEILLSGASFEAVRDGVEVEELGAIHVKNRAEPVSVYKVVALRT